MKQIAVMFLILLLIPVVAESGYNPAFDYVFNPSEEAWGIGGNLTDISPKQFIYLSEEDKLYGGVVASVHYSDFYRSDRFETGNSSYERDLLNTVYLGNGGKIPWQISLAGHSIVGRYGIDQDLEEGTLRVHNGAEAFSTSATAQYRFLNLTTFYESDNADFFKGGFSTLFAPDKNYKLGAAWSRTEHDLNLRAVWEGDEGEIKLHSDYETLTGFLDISPLSFIRLSGVINRNLWINHYDVFGDIDLYPALYPWGNDLDYHALFAINYSEVQTAVGLRQKDADLQARGYKGVGRFSKVTKAYLKNQSEFASVTWVPEKTGLLMLWEVERSKVDSEIKGNLQLWPWSQGWIDLIGFVRYGMGEFEADIYRYHFGIEKQIEDNLKIAGGLNFIDVLPDGRWMDYGNVWTVHDRNKTILEVYRAQVGMLSLGVERQNAGWTFQYEFNQLFPIRLWKHEMIVDDSGDPSPGDSGTTSKRKTRGGGFHRLTLGYSF